LSIGSILIGVALVVFGYLMGSLSPSYFLGKVSKHTDVRLCGSGNAGTTNSFRVLGVKLGIVVLIGDLLKGAIPVLVARQFTSPLVTVFVALACIAGHNYSLLLLVATSNGRGGKGVAAGAGAAIAMMPIPMAFVVALFIILVFSVRIVSVASITCTVLFPVTAVVLKQPLPYLIVCCLMSIVVLWAHRGNFVRLWRRQERRVSFPWNKSAAPVVSGASQVEVTDPQTDQRWAGDGHPR
jgi:glycerol-3-phosphate acyltransferase PlsY